MTLLLGVLQGMESEDVSVILNQVLGLGAELMEDRILKFTRK